MSYAIVVDFGYTRDPNVESTIHDLADIAMIEFGNDPSVEVLAQEESYARLKRIGFPEERLSRIDVGQSETDGVKGGGSYHVLRRASQMIAVAESERLGFATAWPLDDIPVEALAHALHMPRVVRQGRLFGLNLTPAQVLPTTLHWTAAQWWCRNAALWHLREMIGYIPLKIAHQI